MSTKTDALTPYSLAREAGCASPDSNTSPGARFLLGIAEDCAEAWTYRKSEDADDDLMDLATSIANESLPVYTHEKWATFVDLAAYESTVLDEAYELAGDGADFTYTADCALIVIAYRLASELLAQFAAEDDEDDLEEAEDEARDPGYLTSVLYDIYGA